MPEVQFNVNGLGICFGNEQSAAKWRHYSQATFQRSNIMEHLETTVASDRLDELCKLLKRRLIYIPESNLEQLKILADIVKRDEKAGEKISLEEITSQAIDDYILRQNLSEREKKWHRSCTPLAVSAAWEIIENLSIQDKASVVVRVTADTQAVVTKRKDVGQHAQRVQAIIDNLSLREKLLLICTSELACLRGVNIDCFQNTLDHLRWKGEDYFADARKELSDDENLMYLLDLTERAMEINR